MAFTDPTGLYCYYQQGGYDGTAAGSNVIGESAANQTFCQQNGGAWIPLMNTIVTVNGDTGDASYEAGIVDGSGSTVFGGGGSGVGTGQIAGTTQCSTVYSGGDRVASGLEGIINSGSSALKA